MTYEDFRLQLRTLADGVIAIHASCRLAGEAEALLDLEPGVADGVLEDPAAPGWQQPAIASLRNLAPQGSSSLLALPREEAGAALYRAAFVGEVAKLLLRSLASLGGSADRGLRIRIQIGLRDPSSAFLHRLPWEFLFAADERLFFSRSRRTPVVRYLTLPQPTAAEHQATPLRILVCGSQAAGQVDLKLEAEESALREALAGEPRIEPHFERDISLEALREWLLKQEVHVLHFMGHGCCVRGQEGLLWLRDSSGASRSVTGSQLADEVRDFRSLQLVFLNACETAAVAGTSAWSGVATALLEAGVPSVIAMQFPIGDDAARLFSETVYRRIVAGDPVDAAVTEGRLAIVRSRPGTLEWGTPVLFQRAIDGHLMSAARSGPPMPTLGSPLVTTSHKLGLIGAGAVAVALFALLGSRWVEGRGVRSSAIQNQTDTARQPAEERAEKADLPPASLGEASPPAPSLSRDASAPRKPEARPVPTQDLAADPTEDRSAVVPAASVLAIEDGQTVEVPRLEGSVSAMFNELAGAPFVVVSIYASGGETIQRTLMAPATISLPNGAAPVQVVHIDWRSRTIKVRV